MDNHVSWLISCPISDGNFKSHLSAASICDIEQALKLIEGMRGAKGKEMTLLAALRRKRREEADLLKTTWETPETCPHCMEHLSREWSFCPDCGRPTDWSENAQLTLEELREMDGEPVWVVTGSAINAGRGCWDICDWWDKNTVMFPYSGEQPRLDDYGITWTAYRRKPEEASRMRHVCAATGGPCCWCNPGPCNSRKPEGGDSNA